MNKQLRDKWVVALRSGEFRQGMGTLHSVAHNTFCCLGVLCVVEGGIPEEEYNQWATLSPMNKLYLLDNNVDIHCKLYSMNDKGFTFPQIADWIEANIPVEDSPDEAQQG